MRWRFWRRPVHAQPGARRLLVPFSGGRLDSEVLAAALRIVRAEQARVRARVPDRRAAVAHAWTRR